MMIKELEGVNYFLTLNVSYHGLSGNNKDKVRDNNEVREISRNNYHLLK